MVFEALAILSFAFLVFCLWQERNTVQRLGLVAAQMERTAALKSDLRWWQESLRRLAEWQDITETAIHGSTRAVRAVHYGIAAIPFEILEAIPATRHTSRLVRDVHDFTADNVYAAVSAMNDLLGSHSRKWLQTKALTKAGPQRSLVDDPSHSDH